MNPDADAGPDPAIFVIDLPKMPTKNKFLYKNFCLLHSEGTCTSFSKIKSQKEVTKQYESSFFLFFSLLVIEGSGSIPLTWIRIRIHEAQKHVDPDSDPNPQHWWKVKNAYFHTKIH